MREELVELKKYLLSKKVNHSYIGIDELPHYEGYCISDAKSHIEVFYFERGSKFGIQEFSDIGDAVTHFKTQVLADPSIRR